MLEFIWVVCSLGPSSMKPSSASIVALRLVALASRGWGKPFLQQLASSGVGSRPQLQISLLVQPSLVNSSLPIGWCGNVRLGRSTGPKQRVQRDPRKSCQGILGLAAADLWVPINGLIFGGAFAKWLFVRGKQELRLCCLSNCVTRAPLLYFVRSGVALSFKVCESVSQSGIREICPNLHFLQYIKAWMPSTDPVSSITNCYRLIVSYTDPVHSFIIS